MAKPYSVPLPSGEPEEKEPEHPEQLTEVYQKLKQIAISYMKRERASHTLQATALVHEALLQLGKQNPEGWNDRVHFIAAAAKSMRWILLDYAKARKRGKRGGGQLVVTFNEDILPSPTGGFDFLALDRALTQLGNEEPRLARVVELRFFGGLSIDETALVLDVSTGTIKRDWQMARAWLYRELNSDEDTAKE